MGSTKNNYSVKGINDKNFDPVVWSYPRLDFPWISCLHYNYACHIFGRLLKLESNVGHGFITLFNMLLPSCHLTWMDVTPNKGAL